MKIDANLLLLLLTAAITTTCSSPTAGRAEEKNVTLPTIPRDEADPSGDVNAVMSASLIASSAAVHTLEFCYRKLNETLGDIYVKFIKVIKGQLSKSLPGLKSTTHAQTDLKGVFASIARVLAGFRQVLTDIAAVKRTRLCRPAVDMRVSCRYPAACALPSPRKRETFFCRLLDTTRSLSNLEALVRSKATTTELPVGEPTSLRVGPLTPDHLLLCLTTAAVSMMVQELEEVEGVLDQISLTPAVL